VTCVASNEKIIAFKLNLIFFSYTLGFRLHEYVIFGEGFLELTLVRCNTNQTFPVLFLFEERLELLLGVSQITTWVDDVKRVVFVDFEGISLKM